MDFTHFDFGPWLEKWDLTPDGNPVSTPTSRLLPVTKGKTPAMLKVALVSEERRGGALMLWWNGDGAACVYEHDDEAILLERAMGTRSLLSMALEGQDDEASRIACRVASRLHVSRSKPFPDPVPLREWFRALEPGAARYGGSLHQAFVIADGLLRDASDITMLHGDIHHENILDFAERGWLAIDPKCLIGERAFDFANLLCNPELSTVTSPGRLARQAHIIAEAARIDRQRLLQWVAAYAGLSAVWFLDDGMQADSDLAVIDLALAELA